MQIGEGYAIVKLPLPDNPWASVTLSMAEGFQHAVDTYCSEVFFPESGEISPNTIIGPAS
jgi:hypothetical protein